MSGLNLLVFRENRRRVAGCQLRAALVEQLTRLAPQPEQDDLVRTLLLAGELECGVADAGLSGTVPEQCTDTLSDALLRPGSSCDREQLSSALRALSLPKVLEISIPEGFAYYALPPRAYADVLDRLGELPQRVLVVGIRSIGTTLSAVTAAAARLRNREATRITVRPQGHPYNRTVQFSAAQLAVIGQANAGGAAFLVVDEGPGLSGSSFLSVAEALEHAGVPPAQITLLCSREPLAGSLCCADAALRWQRFRSLATPPLQPLPFQAGRFVGGGEWRYQCYRASSEWPAVWPSLERLKYLRENEERDRHLFKFIGFGHYGDRVARREQHAAAAGFAPMPRPESDGFVSYPWIEGSRMASKVSAGVLEHLAAYCGYRVQAFRAESADIDGLQDMAEHNLSELKFDLPAGLELVRPVISDGAMQPHEWVLSREGAILKTDSGSHGDDHFFPGATDIAWDLAGTIVEWRLNRAESEYFLDAYRRAANDDATRRVATYIRAYAVFRCAYCRMAASALPGTEEQARLERAAASYSALLLAMTELAAPVA